MALPTFRVNGAAAQLAVTVSASIATVNASSYNSNLFKVSGATPEMAVQATFASAHSAGLFIVQTQVLSANNVQVDFFNATNGNISHAATPFRFISA